MNDQRKWFLFPKKLDACVEPITRPILKSQGLAGSRIVSDWASIVGAQLAAHTLPEKLSFPQGKKTSGTLVISTENGFATELQHMQPQILERLASYFGYQAITTEKSEAVPKPAPRPTLLRDSMDLTSEIVDCELKEALQSLAKTLSGQN